MRNFIFIENITLIILYSITALICGLSYTKYKEKMMKYLSGLFLFFVLDEFVVFAAEFLAYSNLGRHIIKSFITYPVVNILSATGICIFYLLIFWTLLERKINWYHMMPVLVLLVFSVICSLVPETPEVIWLFYSIRQFIGMALVLYYFYTFITTQNKDYHERLLKLKNMFLVIFIMLSLIVLEDTIVIYKINYFISINSWSNEKNISEDLISIFYVIAAIRYAIKREKEILASRENVKTQVFEMTTLSKDEKERLFCKKYNLTNRESEILHYLLVDKTNQEISADLFITVGTVKAHVHKIFEKTEVDRRSQLICKFEMEELGIS